ncbi:MAG: hypothetical protein KAR42_11045 [candidate division Zixibacteria bacterium]|nr:hypothetical protein [candidate division Zixibacteria bacterium]
MTNDQLFDILRPIIIAVTGVPECILANPNNPSPTGEYCSIQPTQAVGKRGQPNQVRKTGAPVDSVDVSIRRQIACTANVNFYKGDARHRASLLEGCNKRPDISEILYRAKLGWRSVGPINNLTALHSDNYESRSQININLWYELTDEININSIESSSVEVQYEDGTTIVTVDINT